MKELAEGRRSFFRRRQRGEIQDGQGLVCDTRTPVKVMTAFKKTIGRQRVLRPNTRSFAPPIVGGGSVARWR